jgi:hypothetical protein
MRKALGTTLDKRPPRLLIIGDIPETTVEASA